MRGVLSSILIILRIYNDYNDCNSTKNPRNMVQSTFLKQLRMVDFTCFIFEHFNNKVSVSTMKENSLAMTHELSTEIGDTIKSYSSKYRALKQMRSAKFTIDNVLPVRLERAAITIQKYWRKRALLKHKTYVQMEEQLDKQNQLLMFENRALERIIGVYEKDCEVREAMLQKMAKEQIEDVRKQSSELMKKLVVVTLQMQRHKMAEDNIQLLQTEKQQCKDRLKRLKREKERLQGEVGERSQEQECQWMSLLKEANRELLRVSKERGELQRQLKEKVVERCRALMHF